MRRSSASNRPSVDRQQWISIFGMAAFILLLNVVGWGVLIFLVVPQNLSLGTNGVLGIGVGLTAFTLGMRHAFDADHLAAIDNTTRKLMAEGQKPVSVGFWFSLGHSSVVFGLFLLLSFGVRAVAGQVTDEGSALQSTLGTVGILVSGIFLILIGLLNLFVLKRLVSVFRRMREGEYSEAELEEHLNNRGFLYRYLGRITKLVTKPWQMYPLGFLFGLGFDTATQVGDPVFAYLVRGRYVAVGHSRRMFHEFRIWVGAVQTRPEGLLQHHDHRIVGVYRFEHRLHRDLEFGCGQGGGYRRPTRLGRRHQFGSRRVCDCRSVRLHVCSRDIGVPAWSR